MSVRDWFLVGICLAAAIFAFWSWSMLRIVADTERDEETALLIEDTERWLERQR